MSGDAALDHFRARRGAFVCHGVREHHAETIAHRVGQPFGSIVLAHS